MNHSRTFRLLMCWMMLAYVGCESAPVEGPGGQRMAGDAALPDAAMATGLECETDEDCDTAERCKHYGQTSLCVLGCGSDDDCPSTQPTCELYGSGDGLCVRRCRTDGMCAENEVCESREGSNFGACIPAPPSDMIGFGGAGGAGAVEPHRARNFNVAQMPTVLWAINALRTMMGNAFVKK